MIIRPYSITGGEIEQFYGTKKLKIQVEGNATVEGIGKVKKALERATDVKQAVISSLCPSPVIIL